MLLLQAIKVALKATAGHVLYLVEYSSFRYTYIHK